MRFPSRRFLSITGWVHRCDGETIMGLIAWFGKRYPPRVQALPEDLTQKEAARRHMAGLQIRAEEYRKLRDGLRTEFAQTTIGIFRQAVLDIESLQVWECKSWDEFQHLRGQRAAILKLDRKSV